VGVVAASRPLDPAERYFYLLDLLWPMNIVAVAELDRSLEEDRVRAAWGAVAERAPLARSRVVAGEGLGLILESEPAIADDVALVTPRPWRSLVQHEQCARFDVSAGPLMRVRYVADGVGGSALALVAHHAVADARTALWLLQEVVRELAGERARSAAATRLPIPMHEAVVPDHRFSENRAGMLQLLRKLREERDALGALESVPWHDRHAESRDPVLEQLVLSAPETKAVVDLARDAGATVNGVASAALLLAVAGTLDGGEPERTLALTTPADMRSRLSPPIAPREPGMYVTLLASAHRVRPNGFAESARAISDDVRARLARGEGELFYTLTRPDAIAADEDGLARLRSLIDTAPQAIAVSNTGILDDAGDPDWVRSLSFALAPTPNQVAFAAATTYRGRLLINVASDRARVETAAVRRVVEEASGWLRQMRQPGPLESGA
jgi:hypothetical protein